MFLLIIIFPKYLSVAQKRQLANDNLDVITLSQYHKIVVVVVVVIVVTVVILEENQMYQISS